MKTLSIHINEVSKDDYEMFFYDDYSYLFLQVIDHLVKTDKLTGTIQIVNITDMSGVDENDIKKAVSNYLTCESTIVLGLVDVSPIEFPTDVICTDEIAEQIQNALIRDADKMKLVGFKVIDCPAVQIPNSIPFVYPNECGKVLINYFNDLKTKIEGESNGETL